MTSRHKKKIIKIIFSILLTGLMALFYYANNPVTEPVAPGYYRIVEFTDGDTLTVDMNGVEERIRLIGVDTPETKKPNSPVQCYGPEASNFTKDRLKDRQVRLEADPVGNNRDKYDRLLRYAYASDGTLINQALIAQGYGFAYLSFSFSKSADFALSQSEAQDNQSGLWRKCQPKLNDGRWQSNDL